MRKSRHALATKLPFATAFAFAFSLPGARADDAPSPPSTPPASVAAVPATPVSPVGEKAQALREAAGLLEKAEAARGRGNRSFAEQLFSSAELIVGAEAVAELAELFRKGAPPRVQTPLSQLPRDTPPQPEVVGASEQEEPEPKPKKGALFGTLKLEGVVGDPGLGVVTLEPASGKWRPRSPRHRTMEQRNRQFAPRMLVVPVGSSVTFPNFDAVYHNVFSTSEAKAFDLGLYRNGQAREMSFDHEGLVTVGCNLHANMSGYIAVVSAPHYTVVRADGKFSFASLEPGKYRMRVWNERGDKAVTQEITIKPDRNTVTVSMAGATARGALADKFGVTRGAKP